jgi:GTPase SAR1 family protein
MDIFNKNKIVIASQQTTLKLLEQTEAIANEMNLSPDIKKSFNYEVTNIRESTERLELVLSVVGIMKAGKSTLINSLVGKEILPSRNTAMTVIPTYIKHDKSIVGVNYKFKHAQEFSKILEQLKQDGFKTSNDSSLISNRLTKNSFCFNNELTNLVNIHEELEIINDICRYGFEKNKYRERLNNIFRSPDDFPTLHTEFKVLESIESGCDVSNFVVVDTPGSNEARLPILKDIVDQQIARSSALLLVLNYTDLASEADDAMRQRIKEEAGSYKDRLIVAVNRFDAKDHRSMKRKETVSYVKEELLSDINLDEDYIFPVSARNALLSSQTLAFLDENKKFELSCLQGWQKDFLDNTTSGEWDEEDEDDLKAIENPIETERLANKMLKSSQICDFINTAITRAYQNAGPDTLIASLTKLRKLINTRLILSLDADINSSKKTVEELKKRVSRVEEGLLYLNEFMSSVNDRLMGWRESQIIETEINIKKSLELIDIDNLEFKKEFVTGNQSIWFKDILFFNKKNRESIRDDNNEDEFKVKINLLVSSIQGIIDRKLQESSASLAHDLQNDVRKLSKFIETEVLNEINLTPRSLGIEIQFDQNAIDKNDYVETESAINKRERTIFGIGLGWIPIESIAYEVYTVETQKFNKESYLNALMEKLNAIHEDNVILIGKKLQSVADGYQMEVVQICEIIQHSAKSAIEEKNKVTAEENFREKYFLSQMAGLDAISRNSEEIVRGLEKEKGN